MYRLKIMRAVQWADSYTTATSSLEQVKVWGTKNRERYPNHTIVVQIHQKNEGWIDYRLIEDL